MANTVAIVGCGALGGVFAGLLFFVGPLVARALLDPVICSEAGLLELYKDPTLDTKPKLLEERGGAFYSEAATALVASLAAGTGDVQVVDVRNAGALPGLQDDDVVELPARVDANGATPLPQAPLAPELLGLVQHVAGYERLAVRAALDGDRVTARKALLAHPLIGQWAPTDELVTRLLDADVHHLPRFAATRGATA